MSETRPFIGILMLDTAFERVPGDVGNPKTFGYPVRYQEIKGATASRIVSNEHPDDALVNRFVDAARRLEKEGAVGLISSCGFLSVLQPQLSRAVSIPVLLSSLSLIPLIQSSLGQTSVAVITADDTQLSDQAFSAVNIDPETVFISGMQSSKYFTDFIFGSSGSHANRQGLYHDLVNTAQALCDAHPEISTLVLECTNLQPYAAKLSQQLRLPVAGIVNVANLLWEISQPHQY